MIDAAASPPCASASPTRRRPRSGSASTAWSAGERLSRAASAVWATAAGSGPVRGTAGVSRRGLTKEVNNDSLLSMAYRSTERTEARKAEVRGGSSARRGTDRPRRLRRGAGLGGRRPRRGRHRHRLPPLPVEGRPLRRGLPGASQHEVDAMSPRGRIGRRAPSGSPPGSRSLPAARCAGERLPTRCSPSPSTRPSRPSASSSGAPIATLFATVIADGVAGGELPAQAVEVSAPRWSARSAKRSSARSPRPPSNATPRP